MKRYSHRRKFSRLSGFTLIELLVVIAIIAILVAVLVSAGGMALRTAQRARASNMAIQIQTAALNYYTEYSVYPVPSAATASQDYLISDASGSAGAWQGLIYGLSGNINPYDGTTTAPSGAVANSRAIAFLNLKSSDVDSKGGPKNPLPPNSTTNPYFNIAIDNDYDNIIGDSGTASGKLPNFVTSTTTTMNYYTTGGPTGGVAVWANCNGNSSTLPANYVHTY